MFKELSALLKRPALHEQGTAHQREIWTDEHISKGMLQAHLDPMVNAATRPHAHVQEIVSWISSVAPPKKYPALLDLGCGPGIYAELFHKAGYKVTGMDFSKRSIDYAINSAQEKNLPISYIFQDYLALNFNAEYDIITLIYYDFGVLTPENRAKLLAKIHAALKPGGLLIFDVFTPEQNAGREESTSWEYVTESGFSYPHPHICLDSFYKYEDNRIVCSRQVVVSEQGIRTINIWEHMFTQDELTHELNTAGFVLTRFYGNMTGASFNETGKEMCVIAQKNR